MKVYGIKGYQECQHKHIAQEESLYLPRLLMFGPTPPPYHGVSVATQLILEQLTCKGYQVTHVETRRPLELGGRLRRTAVIQDMKALTRFLQRALDRRPEVVYLPISQTTLGLMRDSCTVFLATSLGADVVVHLHGAYLRHLYDSSPRFVRWIVSAALRKVSGAIVLGESLRSIFAGLVPEDRIYVVPNGIPQDAVPEDKFELLHKKRSQNIGSRLRVVYLSNLIESEGYLDVLRAAGECKKRGIPICVSFAGAWVDDSRPLAERIVAKEGLADEVEFLGVVAGEAKWQLLSDSDVFVLPSYYPYEGQPIFIVEAMASGLPVITTRVGCIEDMVRDGINGYLIEPRNPSMLATKLEILYRQPDLRLDMGLQSRKIFEKEFTADKMMAQLEAVFKDVLSRKSRYATLI